MNFRNLTDDQIDSKLRERVKKERLELIETLHLLKEADRRRLYSKFKFESLYEYAVGRLKYEGDQAYRRIAAMKLLKVLPAIEAKIGSGAITLTHINQAQTFFREEKKTGIKRTAEQKLELIEAIENTSTRESKAIIQNEAVQTGLRLENDRLQMFIHANPELQRKIQRLKEIKAHSDPSMDLTDLVSQMCDLALEKWDPVQKAERAKVRNENRIVISETNVENESSKDGEKAPCESELKRENLKPTIEIFAAPRKSQQSDLKYTRTYIPSTIRHAVYLRDHGRCRNCSSQHAIQIEHITPVAMGGSNDLENLCLLCRSCNQRAAIKVYGVSKMESHLQRH